MLIRTSILIIFSLILIGCDTPAHADNHLTETRYCGEPKRDVNGKIIRSQAVVKEFERLFPLPAGYDRKKYQINHALPMVCGGCDAVRNMIWMHVSAKACAEDYCQDRHEQLTMCQKSFKR